MNEIELKAAIDGIGSAIDTKLNAATDAVKEGNKVTSKLKDQVGELVEKQDGFQAQLDKIATTQSKQLVSTASGHKSFTEVFEETVTKSASFKTYVEGNSTSVSMELKAVTVTTPANAVQPGYAPGFFYNPARVTHAREFLSTGKTDSNIVYFIQETGLSNNAATVAEGAAKPESDFTLFANQTAKVNKIATYYSISTEMLTDLPGLTSYISTRLPNKLKYIEDNQILYGTGTGTNLLGLAVGGSAYVPLVSFIGSGANYMDVIIEAALQARQQEYMANVILLNPQDLAKLLITKNSQGTYLTPNVFTGAPFMIDGIPVIGNTAVPAGSFIVGDFANGAFLWDRQDLAVRFSSEDGTNIRQGLVTVELSERLALGIVRPSAMVFGTFAAALAGTP